ncbi:MULTISPECIES: LysR family transcriptional regulator [Pseudomonas]|jgi:DNA-binding transcriptional LysR family regulator|uniref:LysR family transcriptional regulator n=1 Tax=Pseudomonas TaxID=286 RepID=UPI00099D3F68|nr:MULTISPECIES: LysR family transcriptional regulator [Pseudomonas]MCK3840634.1 LysR family transcriptional regulator [Pseudomonas sp. NCIMB 10586]MCK3842566.1 LysR family transcriptional regulator [Pseudomonas sp. W15Feb34]OPB04580.1 LysR family transcriptional regulator [Pseudomonas synxantha]VCU63227.1 LysR family transcriptional regulator [Pseudomonas synxantha]
MDNELQEKRLGYLHEVGLQGGIRKAADVLNVNPSVISRQVALLERSLHLPLLERRGRNVVLTEAGKLLSDHFSETQERREALTKHLNDLRYMRGGTVNLRIGPGMVANFVGNELREFSKVYPDVFVDISSGDMSTTLMMLVRGEVDMALSFGPIENVSLQRRSFTRGPMCAIVPNDHPLRDFTSIPISELAHHRLIALTNTYGIQRYINKMFESENVAFTPAYRCNQQSVAIALCQAGLGVGFMTAQSLGQQAGNSKLIAIPLDHPIARESQCHILRSSDRRLHPASEHLWWLLVNHLERTQSEGAT